MSESTFCLEIFLQPGDFYFGDSDTRIRTLLGSCVSITMWHPRLRIGGMCHYMNSRGRPGRAPGDLDGRYADDVMEMFMAELVRSRTAPAEYEVKMFGAGNQFPGKNAGSTINVPDENIEGGLALLDQYGFSVAKRHIGGNGYRHVVFDVATGNVWIRHVDRPVGED